MRTVYKYKFTNVLELPKGALILNVDFQGEELCLWALVEPTLPTEERYFLVYPTGFLDIPDDVKVIHIKTLLNKGYVWHIFETDRDSIRGGGRGVHVVEGYSE